MGVIICRIKSSGMREAVIYALTGLNLAVIELDRLAKFHWGGC